MKYSPSWKKRSKKSAVSDIIGNLLILAITVTLFSSVLFYVNNLPGPQNQTYADFSYDLSPITGGTTVNLTKNGGQILENDGISIVLIVNNANTQYNISEGGVGDTWSVGETWSKDIFPAFSSDDEVEVMMIDFIENNVVWKSTLLGTGAGGNYAPVITDKGVFEYPAYVGDSVHFYCKIVDLDGDLKPSSVVVDLSTLQPNPSGPLVYSMSYNSANGFYISDTTLLLTADSNGLPYWNGDYVRFEAEDEKGNTAQAMSQMVVYKKSGGGDEYIGPFNNYSSYFVNGTYPPDASGGESSGQDGGVGTTFYYIKRQSDLVITDEFVIGDKVMIEVYSNALRNLALENSFFIYHPITGLQITPQSSTEAFSYGGIFSTFYRYMYNFTVPTENYIYPIQFKMKDNFGTVINIADTITVGGAVYPQLTTFKYVSASSIVETADFNHTDVLYLKINTKDVDLSATTFYISDIQISDYSGRYIIKKSPPAYSSPVTYSAASKPVSSPFKTSATSPSPGNEGTNTGAYTVYIGLKDAYQGWWLPKKNAYTVKISMVSDQGTGGTIGEVYYSLTCQINVTAPLTTTDILASVGSGSFTWSASGASWSDNKIAWYKGGEQWDETVIDGAPNDGPIGLVLADIDGDGDKDVVVGTQDANYANIVWYENQKSDGSAWSSARSVVMPFDALSGVQAADSSSTSNANEDSSVYTTAGTDHFDNGYISQYELCGDIAVGDFDGDGDGDIVASFIHVVVYTSAYGSGDADYTNSFGMYFNRGVNVFWNDGSWTKTTLYSTNDWIAANTANADSNPAALGLETGDFNMDGYDDIVAVYETGVTKVWLSRWSNIVGSITAKETGAFSTISSLKTVPNVAGNTPWSHKQYVPCVSVADMNNDGLPDIIRSSTNDRSVTVFYTQGSISDSVTYIPNAEWSLKSDPSSVTGSRANLNVTDGVYEILTESYQNYPSMNATVSAKGVTDTTGQSIVNLQSDDGTYYRVSNGAVMALESFNLDPSMNTKAITSVKLVAKYTVAAGYAQTNKVQWAFNGMAYQDSTIQPATGTGEIASFDLYARGVDTFLEITNLDVRFQNSDAVPVDFDYVYIEVTFVETRSLAWEWSIPNLLREYHNYTIVAKSSWPSTDSFILEYSVDNTTWFFLTNIDSSTLTTYEFSLTYTTNPNYYFRITDSDRSTTDAGNDTVTIDLMTVRHFARTVSWDSTNRYSAVVPIATTEYVTALAVGDMGKFSADYTPDGLNDIIVGTSKVGSGDDTHTLYQMTQIAWNNYDMKAIYTTTMAIMCSDNGVYDIKNLALGDTDGDGDLDIVVVVGNSFGRDPGTGPTMWHYENNNQAPVGVIWQYGEEYVNILASKGESAINVQTGNIDLTIFLPLTGVVGVVIAGNLLRRVERKRRP